MKRSAHLLKSNRLYLRQIVMGVTQFTYKGTIYGKPDVKV